MIVPTALAVLTAPATITLVATGTEVPANDTPSFMNLLDALAPAGLKALPSCQRASAGVEAMGQATQARFSAEAIVTVTGVNATECARELVSAPWPRAVVYPSIYGPAAALVWHYSPPVATFLVTPSRPTPNFGALLEALVPVGIDALPACRQVAYAVESGAETTVTLTGPNAKWCGARLASTPLPMPADAVELIWATTTHETPTTTSSSTDGPVFAGESGGSGH